MASKNKSTSAATVPTRRLVVVLSALALIAVAGAVDGYFSQRWVSTELLHEASAALHDLPLTIGEWEGTEGEINPQQLKIAEATGALYRVYRHRTTQESFSVMLLCGPHGPISLHPPTVCFVGAGWNLTAAPESQDYIEGKSPGCQFWQAKFDRSGDLRREAILTDWSWNNGQGWKASTDPRFEFAGSPYLFKLYVTGSAPTDSEADRTVREEFVRQLTHEFDRTVLKRIAKTDSSQE